VSFEVRCRSFPASLQQPARFALAVVVIASSGSCSGSTPWAAEPSPSYDSSVLGEFVPPQDAEASLDPRFRSRSIGAVAPANPVESPEVVGERIALARTEGRVLGTFRNTYYDFPSEAEFFNGDATRLYDSSCGVIAQVPKAFHDALCVQGSGVLKSGVPVSFARRDCSCAVTCPRTDQKICYDTLDKARFPWGRGAGGKAITPLLTVAVDSDVVPLDTPIYIPQYEGLPRDLEGSNVHDGCFIAQDRGLKVKGKHVDIFTGEPSLTRLWNKLMPSNKGVTVVVGTEKCRRAN